MLVLELAAKDLIGKAVKAGLVQVWIVEIRDAKDVRVRLVENIVDHKGKLLKLLLCTVLGLHAPCFCSTNGYDGVTILHARRAA
jgi:hypothetical protein